jgi:hypothetical protein
MSGDSEACPECGAPLEAGRRCRDYLNDLLALEWQVPGGPGHRAHFLAVASYNLQHPRQFTPAMLAGLRKTFSDVLAGRATIDDARKRARDALDGTARAVRRPGDPPPGLAGWPAHWAMTIRDVCAAPVDRYLERVAEWAASVDRDLPATVSVDQA